MSLSSSNKENLMVKKPKKISDVQGDKTAQWNCEICGKTYKLKHSLTRHRTYECGVEPQFQCGICYRFFKMRYDLKVHCRAKHNFELGGKMRAVNSLKFATLADLQNVTHMSDVFVGHNMDMR